MSFIGNAPAAIPTSFQAVQADSFNGNGSTTNFTLSRQITNLYDIEVLVDNVQQSPYDGSYSVNGTTITFSSAPGSGTNNIYIVYRDHPITSIAPKGQEIELFSSGGGTFTVTPASSATDRTFTLPDETGTVLTSASSLASSQLPTGSVLQVVHVDGPALTVSKTGAGSLTVLSAAITPSSASNKVLVLGTAYASGNGGSNTWLQIEILRDATILKYGPYQGISLAGQGAALATNYLDSPSTTSETTYHVNIERGSSGTNGWDASADRSSITLMEIAG